jgi:hypothetical protein
VREADPRTRNPSTNCVSISFGRVAISQYEDSLCLQ